MCNDFIKRLLKVCEATVGVAFALLHWKHVSSYSAEIEMEKFIINFCSERTRRTILTAKFKTNYAMLCGIENVMESNDEHRIKVGYFYSTFTHCFGSKQNQLFSYFFLVKIKKTLFHTETLTLCYESIKSTLKITPSHRFRPARKSSHFYRLLCTVNASHCNRSHLPSAFCTQFCHRLL